MKSTVAIICLLFLTTSPFTLSAQNVAPEVSNVFAEQMENSTSVRITYDLTDPDTDLLFVIFQASGDSGKTFNVPAAQVTGDVGYGVTPGPGKEAIWEAYEDYPEITAEFFQIKIIAIDAPVAKMVQVARDTFQMGNNASLDEFGPEHPVLISAFYLGATEITNVQYKQFCDATNRGYPEDPSTGYFLNYPDYPVVNVTWNDAQAYCNWLSELEGLAPCYDFSTSTFDTSKSGYRLPTEAEWEFAARADSVGKDYPWGTDELTLSSCNYLAYDGDLVTKMPSFENGRGPLPVASFDSTGAGLFDLAGNVTEWCLDRYDPEYYLTSPSQDPMGPETGTLRVVRGGDWLRSPEYLRVFHRDKKAPESMVNAYYRGFRVMRRAR